MPERGVYRFVGSENTNALVMLVSVGANKETGALSSMKPVLYVFPPGEGYGKKLPRVPGDEKWDPRPDEGEVNGSSDLYKGTELYLILGMRYPIKIAIGWKATHVGIGGISSWVRLGVQRTTEKDRDTDNDFPLFTLEK